jgi:hypothetical protein
MDVFSTEQGIRLGFVKTSEFQRGLNPPNPPQYAKCKKTHFMLKMKMIPIGRVISITSLLLLSLTYINRSYLESSHIVSWRTVPSKWTWSSTCKWIIKYINSATLLYHLATILVLQFSYRMVQEWWMRGVEGGSQTTSMPNLDTCLYKLMTATRNV